MPVPMMSIRQVWVVVEQRGVPMLMSMGLSSWITWTVVMLMMNIMHVQMGMLERVVQVAVTMAFAEQERDTNCHHGHGQHIVWTERVT